MLPSLALYNHNRGFSCGLVLKVGDNDLFSRIDELMKTNKALQKEAKFNFLKKEKATILESRMALTERLMEEKNKSDLFIQKGMESINAKDAEILNKRSVEFKSILDMYLRKHKELEESKPFDSEKLFNLSVLMGKKAEEEKDFVCKYVSECAIKKCTKEGDNEALIWLKRSITSRITERKEILAEDNMLRKAEKELLLKCLAAERQHSDVPQSVDSEKVNAGTSTGKEKEKEKSSLVSDFADPNLEQPSYMDPED